MTVRATACPDCGDDVITTPTGVRLQPARTRFGQHLPDGTTLTADDLARMRGQPVKAHARHFCTPRPAAPTTAPSDQLGLF